MPIQLQLPSIKPVSAEPNVPYILGNWTYVTKPVSPIQINASQIAIGSDWTYVYHLEAGKNYRVYCYGEWIDDSTDSDKTDYDIFVYDPSGNLESYHTEAAGLPEHLGTTVDHPFFIPKKTGDYSFRIRNDARESNGAQAATFMLIEHIETDQWYQLGMEGKVDDEPVELTSWAYEFNTSRKNIEVIVQVPDTLDMYEARIYLMANPAAKKGSILNGLPIAWEEGLYGTFSGKYGGYNLDSEGLRLAEALASCEYPGEDMLINFTAPSEGNLLYHLVFIAEHGEGDITFMIKTDFESPELALVDEVRRTNPNNSTTINAKIFEQFNLESVTLNYTTDNGAKYKTLNMVGSKATQLYNATIPGQPAGTLVNYTVLARDISGNSATVDGSYFVKNSANITLELSDLIVDFGDNITVSGSTPVSGTNVTLIYAFLNTTKLNNTQTALLMRNDTLLQNATGGSVLSRTVTTDSSGSFADEYRLRRAGTWFVWAKWNGTDTYFDATSNYRNVTIRKIYIALTCNVTSKTVTTGDNLTIIGYVSPPVGKLRVTAKISSANSTITKSAITRNNGTYTIICTPEDMGLWQINANIDGNESISTAYGSTIVFTVTDTFLNQYLLYIIGGAGGAAGVGVVLFIRKRREE
jgi:hypothetical protein